MLFIQETPEGVILKAVILPRSSKNELVGVKGDALKIRLTAPPVEGAANKMCIRFLAEILKVAKSKIEIVSGKGSRTKKILVRSGEKREIEALINNL
nr:YggU family protein [Desulfobacterales bacterium]